MEWYISYIYNYSYCSDSFQLFNIFLICCALNPLQIICCSLFLSLSLLSCSRSLCFCCFYIHRSQHIYASHYKHKRKYYAVNTNSYVVWAKRMIKTRSYKQQHFCSERVWALGEFLLSPTAHRMIFYKCRITVEQ